MDRQFKVGDAVYVTFLKGGYWKGTGWGRVVKLTTDGKRVSVDVKGRVRSFLIDAGNVRLAT